jgi:Domain of unknown function (DUF4314)
VKPEVGLRVRLLSPMTNGPTSCIPVEEGMPAGLEGTIYAVNFDGPREWHQISVKWDNGRGLALMPYTDRFEVFEPKEVTA